MKVVWSRRALVHLQEIHDYVAEDSPEDARRLIDRILRRADQIEQFPLAGRVVPEYGRSFVREVFERPYRIIYRTGADRIEVVGVLHGARRLA